MTIAAALPVELVGPVELVANVPLAERIHDAALCCIARWGVAKTTLDDVAREAGCSRATIYRTFAGGKQGLVTSLSAREAIRLRDHVVVGLEHVRTLEDVAVTVTTRTSHYLGSHSAFQFLLAHEPDVVLPLFGFGRFDETLHAAGATASPALERFMDPPAAARGAQLLVRLLVSHILCPSEVVDLGDEADARRLVRSFVLPGLEALARSPDSLGARTTSKASWQRQQ